MGSRLGSNRRSGIIAAAAAAVLVLVVAVAPAAPSSGSGPAHAAKKKCKRGKHKKCKKHPAAPPQASIPATTVPPATNPQPPACPGEDSDEENDSIAQATVLSLPANVSEFRCPGDNDFFRISVPATKTLTLTVTPSTGWDPELKLFDSGGALLDDKDDNLTSGPETLTYPNAGGTAVTVYAEVTSFSSSQTGPYTLSGSAP